MNLNPNLKPGTGRLRPGSPIHALLILGLAAAFSLLPQTLFAQTTNSPTADPRDEVIRQLLKRVEGLEGEVQALKAKATPTSPQNPPAEEPASPRPNFPDLVFHGFGNFDYHVSDRSGDNNSFSVGTLDLFFTSRLAEDVSVLGEVALEAGDNNAFDVDVERLMFQWTPTEYFNLAIGRYHTAIGYYSTAYHHGVWFQTAVGRPFLFQFEDDDGILPIHNVGLSISGQIPSGSLGLHYVAEIGNGRNYDPAKESVLNVVDDNDYKAFNLALFARPSWCPGLQFGVSGYHDTITPAGLPRIDQAILAAHVVYQKSGFEWLNEGLLLRHAPNDSGHGYYSPGFYTQISRQFGAFRPYLRYQYFNGHYGDPLLHLIGAEGLRHGPSVGLRYDFTDFAAFKAQYNYSLEANDWINELVLQACFTF